MSLGRALALSFAASLAALTLAASPACANDDVLSASTLVSDDDLSAIRGRYVPSGRLPSVAETTANVSTASLPREAATLVVSAPTTSPLLTTSLASGTLQGLDLTMTSSWKTASGTTYTAGLDLAINTVNNTAIPHTWSGVTGGSDLGASLPASINVLGNGFTGVGQTVTLAGDGNAASNRAAVTLGTLPLGPTSITSIAGSACVNACSAGIDAAGAHVAIALPGGVALQQLNANGVLQAINAQSNLNEVQNSLGLHLQVAPAAFRPSMFLPLLGAGMLRH